MSTVGTPSRGDQGYFPGVPVVQAQEEWEAEVRERESYFRLPEGEDPESVRRRSDPDRWRGVWRTEPTEEVEEAVEMVWPENNAAFRVWMGLLWQSLAWPKLSTNTGAASARSRYVLPPTLIANGAPLFAVSAGSARSSSTICSVTRGDFPAHRAPLRGVAALGITVRAGHRRQPLHLVLE